MVSKTGAEILSTVMTWLAVLSTGVFVYATAIKLGTYVKDHVDIILGVTAFLVLFFIAIGKITKASVKAKVARQFGASGKD